MGGAGVSAVSAVSAGGVAEGLTGRARAAVAAREVGAAGVA